MVDPYVGVTVEEEALLSEVMPLYDLDSRSAPVNITMETHLAQSLAIPLYAFHDIQIAMTARNVATRPKINCVSVFASIETKIRLARL